jgi:PAS domain S-box-containing protein
VKRPASTLERRVWLGFVVVVAVALAIGWLVYADSARLHRDQDAVARQYDALNELEATLSSLQDVETGQRGYLLTDNPDSLAPYNDGVQRVGEHLARLGPLTVEDPLQQGRLASLEALAGEKLRLAREAIDIHDRLGDQAAARFDASGRGQAVMDEVRAVVRSMQATETQHLERRTHESDAGTRNTTILTGSLAVLSLALFATLLVLVMRSLASERRAAEAVARLGAIVGASSDAVMSLDLEGRIASWNPGAERLFGYSAAEALGRQVSLIVPPDQSHVQDANLQALREGDEVVGQETVRIGKDGRRVEVSLSAFRILDQAGGLTGFGGVFRDITESKRAEDALRESQQRFATIFHASPVALAITRRADSVLIDANERYLDLFGFTRDEVIGRTTVSQGIFGDLAQRAAVLDRLRSEPAVRDVEMQFRSSSGERIDAILSMEVVELGGQTCVLSAINDITARRELEEALRAGEERFRSVVETATDAIIITDRLGNIEVFNPAAEQMFGYTAGEAAGQNVRVLIPSPQKEEHDNYIEAFLARGTSEVLGMRREMVSQRKDGSVFPHELTVNPMELSGELKFTAIIRDTTARNQLEAELREAKEAAEEANRAKSTFLSRMSHELRTPLNVVLGFGQVLQLDPLDPGQAEAVDYILKAGRHLLDLIDEVLDISRIEAGRLSLSIEPVRADDLLADALMLMRPLASQRGITIRAELDTCDVFVLADRQRTKQVLLNLLANAIKYNREGGVVEIKCDQRESALRIIVTDTGLGIPPERLDRLFTPFDRLGAEATAVEGTGLGLALSKRLIEAMGGAVGVESVVDAGSTFWIELPLGEPPSADPEGAAPQGAADQQAPAAHAKMHSILYIEDNLSNLNLMEHILDRRQGLRLLAAMQGSLGLELAREHHPDLILLDLHLPDMAGSDVLRELKTNLSTRDIPVVVVSADATSGQKARLLDAGARAYLTKPLDLKEFLALTDAILEARP